MSDVARLAEPFAAEPARPATASGVAGGARSVGAAAWADLAQSAAEDNVFFHPDFALPAIACFGAGGVSVATASNAGRLLAVAPYTRGRLGRLAPAVRLWSHPYGPLGVPLLDRDRIDQAAAGLLARLSPMDSATGIIVPDLPLAGPVAAALARAARAGRRSTAVFGRSDRAVAIRHDGHCEMGVRISRHRRHEYARQLRRLADAGRVTIDTAAEAEWVRRRFDEYLELEARGWKGDMATALASDNGRAAFARAAVAAAAARGAIRIHSLRLDDRAIASLVSFVCGGTAYTWKIAYDESHRRASPGAQVLLAATGSLLAEPGVERVDSCAGPNHSLADPLLPGRMAMGTMVISPVGEGALYRAGLAAAKVEAAAMAAARRIRDRLR